LPLNEALGAKGAMPKFLKFLMLAIPVLSFGVFLSIQERNAVLDFMAEGTVVTAKWNTKNHQMSLFEIKPVKGTIKTLHHSRVTLTPEQIKVGDHFSKQAGSTNCFINEVKVVCIN